MTQETTNTIQIDKAKLQVIIDAALKNGRTISTEGMEKDIWLGLRTFGIGGSDVAAVLGISQYKTAYQLWKEKVSDEVESFENKFTIWGNLLEDPVAQEYMRQTKNVVVPDNRLLIHPKHDCLFVNLDRVVMKDGKRIGNVEIKTTVNRVYKHWQENQDDNPQGIPLNYYCQIQHEMSVADLPWTDLVIALLDERELVIKRIERDEEYIQKQNQALVAWWNVYVEQNEAPPMTASEYSFVDPMEESFIEATGEIAELYSNLKAKKQTLKGLKTDIESDEDKIKEFMADNDTLVLIDKVIVTWKMQSRTTIDSKKLKSEKPEIAEEYSKISRSRIFRLKEID